MEYFLDYNNEPEPTTQYATIPIYVLYKYLVLTQFSTRRERANIYIYGPMPIIEY